MKLSSTLASAIISICFTSITASIDEPQEIRAAREAAPPHITDKASYMVWSSGKFRLTIQGSNDFTCLLLTDPHGRYEPSCFNKEAMRSVFPVYEYQTKRLYEGASFPDIQTEIANKAASGEFPKAGQGGLVYMMANTNKWYGHKSQKLHDVPPHLMFYFSSVSNASLGFTQDFGQPDFMEEYPHLSTLIIRTPAH